jgi:hypothetical protein
VFVLVLKEQSVIRTIKCLCRAVKRTIDILDSKCTSLVSGASTFHTK